MKQRILTAVVVIPLFITLSTTPAYAILGSILAGIQRAQMIINQGVQIYKDTMAKITFDGQLTEMIDQASAPERASAWNRGSAHRSLHRIGVRADTVYRTRLELEE